MSAVPFMGATTPRATSMTSPASTTEDAARFAGQHSWTLLYFPIFVLKVSCSSRSPQALALYGRFRQYIWTAMTGWKPNISPVVQICPSAISCILFASNHAIYP